MIWDVFVLKFPYLIFWVITQCDDTKHGWEPQNGVWETLSIDSYRKNTMFDTARQIPASKQVSKSTSGIGYSWIAIAYPPRDCENISLF